MSPRCHRDVARYLLDKVLISNLPSAQQFSVRFHLSNDRNVQNISDIFNKVFLFFFAISISVECQLLKPFKLINRIGQIILSECQNWIYTIVTIVTIMNWCSRTFCSIIEFLINRSMLNSLMSIRRENSVNQNQQGMLIQMFQYHG